VLWPVSCLKKGKRTLKFENSDFQRNCAAYSCKTMILGGTKNNKDNLEQDGLLAEGSISRASSTNSVPQDQEATAKQFGKELNKSIHVIVENVPGLVDVPPLALDPPPIPLPIQQLQLKAMKSKAVEQIQVMLQKRRYLVYIVNKSDIYFITSTRLFIILLQISH
jgi:hypothetical protein